MAQSLIKIVANFETSLASKLEAAGTSFTLVSATDADGNALGGGTYGFTLNEGQSNEEHVVGTVAGATVSSLVRNVQRNDSTTAQTGKTHRKGDSVKVTNFPCLGRIVNILDGTTDFDASTPLKYDGNPTLTDDAHFATKKYIDDVAIAGGADASTTVKGLSKLSSTPSSPTNPIAVGDNDTRVPTQGENDALVGNGEAPATANPFMTKNDVYNLFSGVVIPYAGSSAPTGWLLCYGQAVSRTTYADLFAITSTTYGVGDGSTTFNLPDMRGNMPLGKDDMGGVSRDRVTHANADTLGGEEGAETHTLVTGEIPSHTHTTAMDTSGAYSAGSYIEGSNSTDGNSTTNATGGDGAHENMSPYMALNYIIKT